MKFFIQKENLLYALQVVQRAVSAKSPLPALTGICFHCAKDVLTLTATDFDLSIRCTVPVNMEEEGTLILPAKYITEFTRRLPDTMVTIESRIGNNMAVIRYANSEFNINGYHADDFPVFHIDVYKRQSLYIGQH